MYTHTYSVQRGSSQTMCWGTLSCKLAGAAGGKYSGMQHLLDTVQTARLFIVLSLDCVVFLLIVSHFCIAGFLAVAVIKSKYTVWKINMEQKARIAVSNLISKFENYAVCSRHICPISKLCLTNFLSIFFLSIPPPPNSY